MSAALTAQDVSRIASNGTVLLQDASFTLEEGSILAIAGPNGAGKTTLLDVLSGITDPTNGNVLLGNRSLKQMPAADRARQIAVVGQQDVPDGRLTLRDYVTLGQIPIQADRSAAEHAEALERTLDVTGLTTLADKKMGVLSGGERQRAHIARAIAQNPSILFLDEPTNHLDPDAKGRMLSLVTSLGVTVIMIVHDLVMIPEFATHLALVHDARLKAMGPVGEVLTTANIRDTFGVDYLEFPHEGRVIAALDIRKTHPEPVQTGGM